MFAVRFPEVHTVTIKHTAAITAGTTFDLSFVGDADNHGSKAVTGIKWNEAASAFETALNGAAAPGPANLKFGQGSVAVSEPRGLRCRAMLQDHMARRTCFREQYYTGTRKYICVRESCRQYEAETI